MAISDRRRPRCRQLMPPNPASEDRKGRADQVFDQDRFRAAAEWSWSAGIPAMVACQPAGANSLEAPLRHGATEAMDLPPVESVAASYE